MLSTYEPYGWLGENGMGLWVVWALSGWTCRRWRVVWTVEGERLREKKKATEDVVGQQYEKSNIMLALPIAWQSFMS